MSSQDKINICQELPSYSIEFLWEQKLIDRRLFTHLSKMKIEDIRETLKWRDEDLLSQPGFGEKILQDLKQFQKRFLMTAPELASVNTGEELRVGKKWDEEEEKKLYDGFISGKKLSKLASMHKRKIGGIDKRLKRLGLISELGERVEPVPQFSYTKAKRNRKSRKNESPKAFEMSFSTSNENQKMNSAPLKILNDYFGYDDFRENQPEIIEAVLDGEDAFVLMPTGSGKSICYQIPAILCPGTGIVISPLIALMEDQVKALQQNGVKAAYLNSVLSFQQVQKVQRRAADGRLDMLYVAPERLLTPDFQHFLTHVEPGLFAIDEAHCVSQWGHDFRPEYLRINEVTQKFPNTPRMALTATADEVTRKDILEKLELRQAKVFISSFDRPNIRYHVQIKNRDKHQLLDFIRREHPEGSGIVYARTRKRTESISAWLSQQGVDALPYHAGLPPEMRMENQKRFQENGTRVMVATIAFGMGIDKPDVRFVVHLDLPASMEAYYQETGRAGRDGQPADAWMVYSLADVTALRRLFEMSESGDAFKNVRRQKLEALLGYCESVVCRRKILLNYFGEKHDGACGGCDSCLAPIETWDGTVAAQKALSCVYRTEERFGAGHLTSVLMGKLTRQIQRWNHDKIKTFGVGQELDRNTWMSVFRQLLSAGLLSVDMGKISGFHLTDKGWEVLKKQRDVFFRKDALPSAVPVKKSHPIPAAEVFVDEEQQSLFETFKKLRLNISRHLGVPPYIVFNDKSLKEMALIKPSNVDEFLEINGVGEAKVQRYSEIFLACIRGEETDIATYLERKEDAEEVVTKDENSAGDSGEKKQLIIELLKEGKLTSAEIAKKAGVSPPTFWAFKGNLTMGKYDTPDNKEPVNEDPLKDWIPDPEVVLFIRGKIQALGSIEAVNALYKDDSQGKRVRKAHGPPYIE